MSAEKDTNDCPLCYEERKEQFTLPCCKKEVCAECLCKSTVHQLAEPKCPFCTKLMSGQKNALIVTYSMSVCSNDNWRYDAGTYGCTNPDCVDYNTSVFGGKKRSYNPKTERFHEVFTVKLHASDSNGVLVLLSESRMFGFGSGVTLPVRAYFLHSDGTMSAFFQGKLIPHSSDKWAPKWAPFILSVQEASTPRVRMH